MLMNVAKDFALIFFSDYSNEHTTKFDFICVYKNVITEKTTTTETKVIFFLKH